MPVIMSRKLVSESVALSFTGNSAITEEINAICQRPDPFEILLDQQNRDTLGAQISADLFDPLNDKYG
jgi:hypothetical protein